MVLFHNLISIYRKKSITSFINALKRFNVFPKRHLSILQCVSEPTNLSIVLNRRYLESSKVFTAKYSMHRGDEFESYQYEPLYYDLVDDIESESLNNSLKSALYPNSNDPIILQLNKCNTVQDVIDIIKQKSDSLQHNHLCQTMLVLWDLQKIYVESYLNNLGKSDIECSLEMLIDNYRKELLANKEIANFLDLVSNNCHLFNIEELSFTMLYLKRIGFDFRTPLMEKFIGHMTEYFFENNVKWNLISLEKFTQSIKSSDNLRYAYWANRTIPYIINFMDNCNTANDFRIITICLNNAHLVVTNEILERYKSKCLELINSGIITSVHYKTIIQVLNFLNLHHWSKNHLNETVFLAQLIQSSIPKMNAPDLIFVHRVLQAQLEPATVIKDIRNRVTYLLKQTHIDVNVKVYIRLPDLLFCQSFNAFPENRMIIEKIVLDILNSSFTSLLFPLFNTIKHLKISDSEACSLFWSKIATHCIGNPLYANKTLHLAYRYMFFNNTKRENFRSFKFEEKMLKQMSILINDAIETHVPWKLSRYLSFVLAYGLTRMTNTTEIDFIKNLLDKLYDVSSHLKPIDSFILSRALQINTTINTNTKVDASQIVLKANIILNKCLSGYLLQNKISLLDLNVLSKSYMNCNTTLDTEDFNVLLSKYSNVGTDELSSRLIQQAANNFSYSQTFVPSFLEKTFDYIILKNDILMGDIVQKILYCCYLSGYIPKNEDFFPVAVKLIEREKDHMSAISILNSCVALAYFGHLPESLSKHIFSFEFMERLDLEISSCYAKKSYPLRLRKQLMNLNRVVCLDYPEHNIPWFHQSYIDDYITYGTLRKTVIRKEVLDILTNLTKKKDTIKYPYFSPYGYKIDFFLKLDKDNVPVSLNKVSENDSDKKIAVIILGKECFSNICVDSTNNSENIKLIRNGPIQMRSRHLEQMGYQVIEISNAFWNTMHMMEPHAKMNFLKNAIFQ